MAKNQTIRERADQKTHSPETVGISLSLLGGVEVFEAEVGVLHRLLAGTHGV
jgi:hypothetical protein